MLVCARSHRRYRSANHCSVSRIRRSSPTTCNSRASCMPGDIARRQSGHHRLLVCLLGGVPPDVCTDCIPLCHDSNVCSVLAYGYRHYVMYVQHPFLCNQPPVARFPAFPGQVTPHLGAGARECLAQLRGGARGRRDTCGVELSVHAR
ncbi:unnamed protein product [Symbiodinium natans]|uniref:Uncharacterized protein n=1 Tax=Symbiodinium natans TaxID=878477 RepID=A0A812KQW7_9DINO|nr:unnamed protein product [Symbiodinium natans]